MGQAKNSFLRQGSFSARGATPAHGIQRQDERPAFIVFFQTNTFSPHGAKARNNRLSLWLIMIKTAPKGARLMISTNRPIWYVHLIRTCRAYYWVIFPGVDAIRTRRDRIIHRKSRATSVSCSSVSHSSTLWYVIA
jgi:hypothetical protein